MKRDYVAIMINGMKTIDDVIQEVPAAIDQYIHYACAAFNTGLTLHNSSQVNDATSLARLSCEAGSKWYFAHSDESNAVSTVSCVTHVIFIALVVANTPRAAHSAC